VKKLLFVDDDADFLEAQAAFFRGRGYDVQTARSTEEAVEAIEARVPDFVFLDLMMEHYDSGFKLGHRLRQDPRLESTPIVMLSGVAAATGHRFDNEARGLKAWSRLDAFLNKPVTASQLLRVIEERLGPQPAPHA
jgi:two-component system nitrogen regulation response regulator NtrX